MRGLCQYDPSVSQGTGSDTLSNYVSKDSLPFKEVTGLLEDKSGTIWIGTFQGLFKYDGKTFQQFAELPKHLAYYITEDKSGGIWLSTGEFNPSTNAAKQCLFWYNSGKFIKVLEKFEPGDNQIFGKTADKDGNIWFGTMRGPCRHDPFAEKNNSNAFVYFTE